MQHQRIFFILSAIFLATAWAELHLFGKVQPQTECDTVKSISLICYQCSKRHDADFMTVYNGCCGGDPELRTYCEDIYTIAPSR